MVVHHPSKLVVPVRFWSLALSLKLVYTWYMEYKVVKINEVVPHLLTYPRSGSHYFDDMLYQQEKIHFTKSHYLNELFDENNNKKRPIITIARDPIDSVRSYLALNKYLHLDNLEGRQYTVLEKITEYAFMYAFLCENADYVIDFNDLVSYPESVIKKILNLLNIDKNKYIFFDNFKDVRYKDYIPSSKSLPNYENNFLDNFDFNLCYYYYHKLLEKKIIV